MSEEKKITRKEIIEFVERLQKDKIPFAFLTGELDDEEGGGVFGLEGYGKDLAAMYMGAMDSDQRFAELLAGVCMMYGLERIKAQLEMEELKRNGRVNVS